MDDEDMVSDTSARKNKEIYGDMDQPETDRLIDTRDFAPKRRRPLQPDHPLNEHIYARIQHDPQGKVVVVEPVPPRPDRPDRPAPALPRQGPLVPTDLPVIVLPPTAQVPPPVKPKSVHPAAALIKKLHLEPIRKEPL